MSKSIRQILMDFLKTFNLIQLIKDCYANNALRYIFYGVLSTLVNFLVFILFKDLLHWQVTLSNTISVATAIVFAYYVNARFVFYSQATGFKEQGQEFVAFVSARLVTMVIEIFGVELLADFLKIDALISKVLINVIVLILNYIFSLFIFKKKGDK